MFTKAITRKPCRALIDGITTAMFGEGTPDYDLAVKQHDNYVATLRSLGLEVLDLDADERYPDSCFVEDPAVVMPECAIITNPATDSRNGEKFEIIDAIRKFYSEDQIFHIEAPGTMEGGDVMLVDKHFYVGQSDRTNADGFRQFAGIVSRFGYEATAVPVTEGLHLKRRCLVSTTSRKPPRRALLCFSSQPQTSVDESALCLTAPDGSRSIAYKELTDAFYLDKL